MFDTFSTEESEFPAFSCVCAACATSSSHDSYWRSFETDASLTPVEQTATGTTFTTSTVTSDGVDLGDAVLSGFKWATTSLTYSFPNATADYGYNDHGGQFFKLSTAQQEAARAGFDQLAAVSGLTFTELTGTQDRNADLRLAEGGVPPTAWAYLPSSAEQGGDVWFNPTDYNVPTVGSYAFSTFLHEIGHAVGLKHGHENDFVGALPTAFDSHEYSLMTYRSSINGSLFYTNAHGHGPQTFMMADIQAIQTMYGANFDTNSDDTRYTFATVNGVMMVNGVSAGGSSANVVFRTIWDGGGVDTYSFVNYTTDLAIDLSPGGYVDLDVGGNFQRANLAPGTWARGHVFNALQFQGDARSLIENAIGGSGDDTLQGNAADNSLAGGAGDDTLMGGLGDDRLDGGDGTDTVTYAEHSSTYGLSVVGNFVQVVGEGADVILDTVETIAFRNRSFTFAELFELAESGNQDPGDEDPGDQDPVGPTEGRDTLAGTADADTIDGLGGNDVISGGAGNDDLSGGAGGDRVNGEDGDDGIDGGAGNDKLYGGDGIDEILGGADNDKLYGDAGDDVLDGGDGKDALAGGDGNDDLFGGLGADKLAGGAGNDRLYGGDDRDALDGGAGDDTVLGGAGADKMKGGIGNDVVLGGSDNDQLDGGTGNDSLDGGGGDDRIKGGAGDDILSGDAGLDNLTGGAGADQFVITANSGTDVIRDFSIAEDSLDLTALGLTDRDDLNLTVVGRNLSIGAGSVTIDLVKVTEEQLADMTILF